uniref:dTMP kinase n=1 Tax=Streptococcus suis TaxID=1307 RepID=UPI00370D77EC
GEVLHLDRLNYSTFSYQGAGRLFDLKPLSTLERMVQTCTAPQPDLLREPHLTLWFDLPAEVAAERLASARVPDRFE